MFDLGIDKLVVVAILVGLIVGPERMREWRHSLPQRLGRLHALYRQGRSQVVDELNDLAPDWRDYDPRRLHPRRILQDLEEASAGSAEAEEASAVSAEAHRHQAKATADPGERAGQTAQESAEEAGPEPGTPAPRESAEEAGPEPGIAAPREGEDRALPAEGVDPPSTPATSTAPDADTPTVRPEDEGGVGPTSSGPERDGRRSPAGR